MSDERDLKDVMNSMARYLSFIEEVNEDTKDMKLPENVDIFSEMMKIDEVQRMQQEKEKAGCQHLARCRQILDLIR